VILPGCMRWEGEMACVVAGAGNGRVALVVTANPVGGHRRAERIVVLTLRMLG
jgi:hypothetical protein